MSASSQKRGLGRSFESLIPTDLLDESFDPTASQDQQVSELRHIKITEIIADPDQPRKRFDEEELHALAESISEYGVLQPIVVSPCKGGYQIVAGERRFRASKLAGLDKIPALVRTLSDQHKLEISLIENLQRQDLNVLETATAYMKLRDQFNLTLDEIGRRVGDKSVSSVSNKLRLLKLPNFVKKLLINNEITEGQVRPLIGLDESMLERVVPRMIAESWSARKIEQYVVDLKKQQSSTVKGQKIEKQAYMRQLGIFKDKLKTDVKIHTNSRGAGYITIKFKDEKDLSRLQDLIK